MKWVPPPARVEGDRLLKSQQAAQRIRDEAAARAAEMTAHAHAVDVAEQKSLDDRVTQLESGLKNLQAGIPKIIPGGGGGRRMVAKVLARDFPDLGSGGGTLDPETLAKIDLLVERYAKYALNNADTPHSLCHTATGVFAVGDMIWVDYFDVNLDAESGGFLKVVQALGSPYGGTLGSFTNGGTTGALIEGLNYRFAIVPAKGGMIDIRRCGVRCVETVTGWHSRFNEICAYAKNQGRITLTGSGVLSCTETVFLDRVRWDGSRIRFQGGTHAPNGATSGPSTFFTATQTNTAVTIAAGTPIVVTHTGHGFSDNQEIMLGTTGKLPGALTIMLKYFVKVVNANSYNLATSSGGAAIGSATAGNGTHYAFYGSTAALPAQNNITTQDIMEYNGKIKRLGIVVRAGTNGSNKDYLKQDVIVWGDGNSDWTTPPSTLAVRHESDDSSNADYHYVTNYTYVGCGIQGPSEKHALCVTGIYSGYLVYLLSGSSADTLRVRIHGNDCLSFYTEHHGSDTSVSVDMDCESSFDPASLANFDGADDTPAILIRNGKATSLAGELRAMNGLNNIVIDSGSGITGTALRFGVDTIIFNNLRMVHGHGIALTIKRARYVSGQIHIKDWDDANGPLAANCPLIQIGRVATAAGLYIDAVDIANFEGVNVGGATYGGGYYPWGAHVGHYAISMGSVLQFNTDSADGTLGTERSGINAFPTTLLACNIEKWHDCVIDLTGAKGNITLAAAANGGSVMVDPLAKNYTIDDASSAAATIGYPTLSTSGLTIT